MKRANFRAFNQDYKGFIIIESFCDLVNFYDEIHRTEVKKSSVQLVGRANGRIEKHATDAITHAVEKIQEIEPRGIIYTQAKLIASVNIAWEKYLTEGEKLAINPFNKISYFIIPDDTELEFIAVDKYTKDDIHISRYPDGSHWYARLANIDVVVDGEVKWNAKWVAQKKAEEFLENYYK